MPNSLSKRHLTSISDLSREEMLLILQTARSFKEKPPGNLLSGKVLGTLFFEPSTRTRLSFESAALRLGASVISVCESEHSSLKKGESLADTIRAVSSYVDAIILRHPLEGAARLASLHASVPVINAGDGSHQHPTQTLLDLFTMQECHQNLEEIRIAFVGDLLHGRTVHSLAQACSLFNMRQYFVSLPSLALPDSICDILRRNRCKFSFHADLPEILPKIDILYMTRLQKERLSPSLQNSLKNAFILNNALLKGAKKELKILHPLPRIDEIDIEVDTTAHAYYFEQSANGIPVRQALLAHLLNPNEWSHV